MMTTCEEIETRLATIFCGNFTCGSQGEEIETNIYLNRETMKSWFTCPTCGKLHTRIRNFFEY